MNLLARHSIARINRAKEAYCKSGHGQTRLALERRIRGKCNLLLNLDMPKGARSVLGEGTSLDGTRGKNKEELARLRRELFAELSPLIESCERGPNLRGNSVTFFFIMGYLATKVYASKNSVWYNNVDNLLEAVWWSHFASHAAYELKSIFGASKAVKDYFSAKFSLIGPTLIFGVGSLLEVLQKYRIYPGTFDKLDFVYIAAGALIGYLTGKIAVHDSWIYKGKFKD